MLDEALRKQVKSSAAEKHTVLVFREMRYKVSFMMAFVWLSIPSIWLFSIRTRSSCAVGELLELR